MIEILLTVVVLTILVGALIAVTINTSNEFYKIRKSLKYLQGELEAARKKTYRVSDELRVLRSSGALSDRPRKGKLEGDLEIYHQGRVATVKAVFKTRA